MAHLHLFSLIIWSLKHYLNAFVMHTPRIMCTVIAKPDFPIV